MKREDISKLVAVAVADSDKLTEVVDELYGVVKELQHHKDTTIGLWATDRPDLVEDPKKIMFQLK